MFKGYLEGEKQMNKCCIVTYVFGRDYQSFIPLYIYFLNVEYPEYDICIYTDRKLCSKYEEQLKQLNAINYSIRIFDVQKLGLTDKALENYNISRAIRWFLLEDEFLKYEAIYSGDIDIIISHEREGLFEQHKCHSEFIGLPYSNCIRTYKEINSVRHFLGNVKRYGLRDAVKTAVFPVREWNRLTGLHFMLTKECYPFLKQEIPNLIKELNKVVEGKSSYWTKCSINDESILYELMKRSNIGVPQKMPEEHATGVTLVENNNPQTIAFRPHHGLHIALWKSEKIDEKVAMCSTYVNYFLDFYNKYHANDMIRWIIDNNDDIAEILVKKMIKYYQEKGVI